MAACPSDIDCPSLSTDCRTMQAPASCHVRLIAPSGYPHDREAMTRGITRLSHAGCRVEGVDVIDRTELRYAGSDVQRAADINNLATLDTVPDIAMSIRG